MNALGVGCTLAVGMHNSVLEAFLHVRQNGFIIGHKEYTAMIGDGCDQLLVCFMQIGLFADLV